MYELKLTFKSGRVVTIVNVFDYRLSETFLTVYWKQPAENICSHMNLVDVVTIDVRKEDTRVQE